MIHQARPEDEDGILKLIIEFYEESLGEYKVSFDWETLRETIKNFIRNQIVIVAERNNVIEGVIAGQVANSIFDKQEIIGQETIWYITKKARQGTTGLRLITAFEDACRNRGAKQVVMIGMSNLYNGVLDRFYRMRNYRLIERHYIKEV